MDSLLQHITEIEKKIVTSEDCYLIEHLSLPYSSMEDIKKDIEKGKLSLRGEYNGEFLQDFAELSTKMWHNAWVSGTFIIMALLSIWSLYKGNYLLLWNIPLCLFGFFSSSPYNKTLRFLFIAGLALFVYFIFTANANGYLLSGAFFFSLWSAITARHICINAFTEYALKSEIIFTSLINKGIINLYNTNRPVK